MSDLAIPESDETEKRSKKPLLFGLALAVVLCVLGFYLVATGKILSSNHQSASELAKIDGMEPLPDIVFVPVQPLVINIGPSGINRYLRFQAQLEVEPSAEQEIILLLPRIIDVLNGYLRAVETTELEERSALSRMRAQMLRRVQVVTGEGRVRDLLIMEFVLN